ncbi:MAG: glycerophosphodiester phosphodiesterase [Chloroflexi bacterium]|nr:glycerophosphodiester phosphodiesterase [Chloroflexota bacterium]
MNKLENLAQPAIFGHRGASGYAPENTMAAFELAIRQGADGIEFDVKLSSDGHVVIIHDPSVDRTTNGTGWVKNLTLKELKALDAGSSFSSRFAGEPIPGLAELFEHLRDQIYFNIELTNYTTQNDALPEKTAELVLQYHLQDNIIFSSFSKKTLTRIKALLPQVPVAMLASRGLLGIVNRSVIGRNVAPDALHPHYTDVTPALMRHQKEIGRKVNVWTVNDESAMRRMIDYGVNGIITNDPKLAQHIRETG